MNILDEAKKIMDDRSEEQDRQYGPFGESLERAAIIATQMTGLEITPKDFMKCLIALKLSRMRYNLKEDTMLDAVAYIHGLDKYHKECEKQVSELPFSKESALPFGYKCTYIGGEYKCMFAGASCVRCPQCVEDNLWDDNPFDSSWDTANHNERLALINTRYSDMLIASLLAGVEYKISQFPRAEYIGSNIIIRTCREELVTVYNGKFAKIVGSNE